MKSAVAYILTSLAPVPLLLLAAGAASDRITVGPKDEDGSPGAAVDCESVLDILGPSAEDGNILPPLPRRPKDGANVDAAAWRNWKTRSTRTRQLMPSLCATRYQCPNRTNAQTPLINTACR